MRVLFVTWAWGSHFNPTVPFGWALRAAGHEVMVVSHPRFAKTITDAGLPALPAGEHVDLPAVVRDTLAKAGWYSRKHGRHRDIAKQTGDEKNDRQPDRAEQEQAEKQAEQKQAESRHSDADRARHQPVSLDSRRGLRVLQIAADSAAAMSDDALRLCAQWRPDAVVYEPFGFLGPVLAARLGVPAVRQLWTVDFLNTITDVEEILLGDLAKRLDAPRINAIGDMTLDPCPPRLQVKDELVRQPMRYVPYNGPAVEPAWLRKPKQRRKRICVTWGTSIDSLGLNANLLAPAVVRTLAQHDVEIVVAVVDAQRELFGVPPENVVNVGQVPLDQVLPDCDAIVHQGGGGTTMTSVKHGMPQFVLPILPDTMFNAQHVAASGAGTYLWGADATPEVLTQEIADFLTGLDGSGGYTEAATEMRNEHLAMPSPAEVVPVLEEMVR